MPMSASVNAGASLIPSPTMAVGFFRRNAATVSAFFPGKGFDRSRIVKQQDTWLMWITLCFLTASVVILGMYPGLLSPAVGDILAPLFA